MDPRRASGVAVVEPNDVEAAASQLLAEVLGPSEHLHPEPHDQQHRRILLAAERLVAEPDPADVAND